MNRRSFLYTSAVATVALTVAPRMFFAAKRRVLYGDGVHDDTEAVQALFDGETVYRPDGSVHPSSPNGVYLSGGTYRCESPIMVRDNTVIENCHFTGEASPILYMTNTRGFSLSNSTTTGAQL